MIHDLLDPVAVVLRYPHRFCDREITKGVGSGPDASFAAEIANEFIEAAPRQASPNATPRPVEVDEQWTRMRRASALGSTARESS